MQLLVRKPDGRMVAVQAHADERVSAFKARAVGGAPEDVRLVRAGRSLDDAQTLGQQQLEDNTLLQAVTRVRGGVMTSVKLVTQRHSATSVSIDVEEGDRPSVVKQRLQKAIGVPAADMKLRLCGHNQMVMIDTVSNIKVGSCGVTQAVQEVDSGVPLPQSFNYSS